MASLAVQRGVSPKPEAHTVLTGECTVCVLSFNVDELFCAKVVCGKGDEKVRFNSSLQALLLPYVVGWETGKEGKHR